MKKIISIALMVLVVLIVAAGLVGCAEYVEAQPSSFEASGQANEEAVKSIINNDTLPKITRSLERENIKRRVEFINQPDRIGYLYLLSENGQLIKEVQVLGKVSSLNSYLTPMEDIQLIEHKGDNRWIVTPVTTQAADLDGTYGENAAGIFWFTPDGIYQEWSGLYFYSSDRMTFTTQPLLMEISE